MGTWRGRGGMALLMILIVVIAVAHVVGIARIPDGLFQDEASIGFNAWLISQTGRDEHGALLPLYFKSFGDYKAPIYIYAVAGAFAVFGPSTTVLRCTSAAFLGLFVLSIVALTSRRGSDVRILSYALVAGGCLPWYFTISRIGFEVISQIAIMGWAIYCQYVAFHDPMTQHRHTPAAACGALLGLAVYTYPTARVTSFLYLGVIVMLVWRHHSRWLLATLTGAFSIALVPYMFYAFRNADALVARFGNVTYLHEPSLGWLAKVGIFIGIYIAHFDLSFLLLSGDSNLRHSTGTAGQLFVTVFALSIFGIARMASRPSWRNETFFISLCIGLLVSPVGAALTYAGIPHALRSAVMGMFFLLLSCEGLRILLNQTGVRAIWRTLLGGVLILEASLFLIGYFTTYVPKSRVAFEGGSFEASLVRAIAQGPAMVMVTEGFQAFVPQYYEVTLSNPQHIPIRLGPMEPAPGVCLIYSMADRAAIDASPLRMVDLSDAESVVGVRCYPVSASG